jgi:hypothetical protein
VSTDLDVHWEDISKEITSLSSNNKSLSIIRKLQFSNFPAPNRQLESFLFDLFPIMQSNDFDFIFASKCKFIKLVIDSHCFKWSSEYPFWFDFILYLFCMCGYMAIITLAKTYDDIPITKELIIHNFAILFLEHQFILRCAISGIMN